jgi:hypothetical protein
MMGPDPAAGLIMVEGTTMMAGIEAARGGGGGTQEPGGPQ